MSFEGENVAMDITQVGAHESLMQSPPHRETILDSRFNYAGCAAVWDKGRLWVVEDFAHAKRNYSAEDSEDLIAKAIDTNREKGQLPALRRIRLDWLREVACGMAQADSVQTSATRDLRREYNIVARQAQLNAALDLDKNQTQVAPPAEDDNTLMSDVLQGPAISGIRFGIPVDEDFDTSVL